MGVLHFIRFFEGFLFIFFFFSKKRMGGFHFSPLLAFSPHQSPSVCEH